MYRDAVDRNPQIAMNAYIEREAQFPAADGFEVVMVGSSDVAMIRHTHSHYFGIESFDGILQTLEGSIAGISKGLPVGLGPQKVLQVLVRRRHWSRGKMVSQSTVKNHFCKGVSEFDQAVEWLVEHELVVRKGSDGIYLNIEKKALIEGYL